MERLTDVLELVPSLKAKGEAFALATVVRTVAATAAKAGAKAIVRADGAISEGWIGGGCARSAVVKAAREAIADGKARLISVQPPDVLQEHGVAAGEEREGVRFARNTCPSHGTMDIFIEPVLPRPQLVLCGSSPVAAAVADLAQRLGFSVTVCAPSAEHEAFADTERRIDGYAPPVSEEGERFIVVATQSRGDEEALEAALATDAPYVAFVGSRLKAQKLKAALARRGVDARRLAGLRAPAGLDLGAVGPEEIALSILAEIVSFRRGREPPRSGPVDE
jgi:xanthine dehydrogenase accessory factor